ncbi:DUF1707 domain-containing protein [Streptomyces sp. NPDC094448]|uniref:DUF1707 SHOCT-like domain-containing protein n=1 Tax=Streptomyces sp. NPDC094448 TaxID=3366063 RepID=UPI00380C0364
MSELPEIRASDTERERIAERLREAAAEGRLGMDEFNERLDAAYRARTRGDLESLVGDLPETAHGGSLSAVGGQAPRRWTDRIGGRAGSRQAFALWGGFDRRGRWTVPRVFTAFALMGGGDLDLREADFEDREITVRCWSVMGRIDIAVPPEVTVEVTGARVLGRFREEGGVEPRIDPAAPRIRVRGLALMGGVVVTRKHTKAERQRLKDEHEQERRSRSRLSEGEDRRQLG